MFERRVRVLLIVFCVAVAVLIGRLIELQVVRGNYYRQRSEDSLLLTPRWLPFVRGSIRDRRGEPLVSQEPGWEVAIEFGVLAAEVGKNAESMRREVKRLKRTKRYPDAASDEEIENAFRGDLSRMWTEFARFQLAREPESVSMLQARAQDICDRVARIRRAVAVRRGFDGPVAEENDSHAILVGLDSQARIEALESLSFYPWVEIKPTTVRWFHHDATPIAHVLGRTGRVDAEDVARDPYADDPFAAYRADDVIGISGVEHAAEEILRGRRGRLTRDRAAEIVEYIPAENGRDVELTVHLELQRQLYHILEKAVRDVSDSSGGAIVVIDPASREVLALVSYPTYNPAEFETSFAALRDDTEHLPLRFRAVANHYAPGSTVKPLTCLAAFMHGQLTLETRENCTGYLFEDQRDHWRCWEVHGTSLRKAHGSVDVVEALCGSCNIFMYRLGERLGVDGLTSVFDLVGIGHPSGTGLPEEQDGINPTTSWLKSRRSVVPTPGHARNFALGQGELSMTPIQVANLMATYATGEFSKTRLIRDVQSSNKVQLPASNEQWRAIRRGLYRVVNDPEGTAYEHAHFLHDRYALCGKTGSATANPWPTAYRIPYVDEHGVPGVAMMREGAREPALDRFRKEFPLAKFDPRRVEVASRWPTTGSESGDRHSHAWFGGFLQPLGRDGTPNWSAAPKTAFTVLIEFGGSGGRTTGPLAKQVVHTLLDLMGPELDPDASPGSNRG